MAEGNPDDVVCGFDTVVECEARCSASRRTRPTPCGCCARSPGVSTAYHTRRLHLPGPPCRRHCRDDRCPFLAYRGGRPVRLRAHAGALRQGGSLCHPRTRGAVVCGHRRMLLQHHGAAGSPHGAAAARAYLTRTAPETGVCMGKICNFFTCFFGRIHAMFTKDIGIDLAPPTPLCT